MPRACIMAIVSAMMDSDTDDFVTDDEIDIDEWIRLLNSED